MKNKKSVLSEKRITPKKITDQNKQYDGAVSEDRNINYLRRTVILEKLPGYFLLLCLSVSIFLLFYVLWPFITELFIGAIMAVAFYPLYKKIVKWFGGRETLASLTTCLIVILVILVPLFFFTLIVTTEASEAYRDMKVQIESGAYDTYFQWEKGGFFYDLQVMLSEKVSPVIDLENLDIKKNILNITQVVSSFLAKQSLYLLQNFVSFLLGIVLMIFALYYFFKDGEKLVKKIGFISPLPQVYEQELFKKIASMINAIIFGVFLAAILQGVVGGLGFAIVGIKSPVFWGTVMAFLSLLPAIGAALVWGPAVLFLLINGDYYSAIFLAIWGGILVSSVDNVARTFIIGAKVRVYPLMLFFVILGGAFVLGFKGIIIGPLILILLMSFLHIYQAEYGRVLKKNDDIKLLET